MTDDILTLRGVSKRFNRPDGSELFNLRDVSASFQAGEIVALMGRSGSGKSTLAHICGLLMSADSGQVIIKGRDVTRLSSNAAADFRAHHIGLVFQAANLLPQFRAYRNVMVPALVSFGQARRAADTALTAVGLADRLASRPGELSGGEQQRVALARAWINKPDLLIADEPTGNLDQESEDILLRLFREYADQGRTVLIATHSQRVADTSDRILRIDSGRLTSAT
jgi:ABC-type lipoprotein export system ATPase subunit